MGNQISLIDMIKECENEREEIIRDTDQEIKNS
jgi:hypothetical protein